MGRLPMMVKLYAGFCEGRFREKECDFSEGITVDQLLEELKMSKDEVGVVLVNGLQVERDYKLSKIDSLAIFPLIAGG